MEGKDEVEKKQWCARARHAAAAAPCPREVAPLCPPPPGRIARDPSRARRPRDAAGGRGSRNRNGGRGISRARARADVAPRPARAQARVLGRVRVLHDHHGPDELPLLVHPVLLLYVARVANRARARARAPPPSLPPLPSPRPVATGMIPRRLGGGPGAPRARARARRHQDCVPRVVHDAGHQGACGRTRAPPTRDRTSHAARRRHRRAQGASKLYDMAKPKLEAILAGAKTD